MTLIAIATAVFFIGIVLLIMFLTHRKQ